MTGYKFYGQLSRADEDQEGSHQIVFTSSVLFCYFVVMLFFFVYVRIVRT